MKLLILSLFFVGFSFMNSADAASRFEIKQLVIEEARSNDTVPVSLALAVAKVESDFNAKALSSAGARGVMQIMPATARGEFGVAPNQLWNAQTNIELGISFLEQLYEQYDGRWDLALSHYNGGTIKNNRVHSYTKKYVASVQKWQRIYEEQSQLWAMDEDHDEGREYAAIDQDRFYEWGEEDRFIQSEDDFFYDRETEIIIVDRPRDPRWSRPPPPKHRFGHRPPRGRGFY